MTIKALSHRLSTIEKKIGNRFDEHLEKHLWITFLESVMPAGANWNLEAEAACFLSKKITCGSVIGSVMGTTPELPNINQPMLETGLTPPSEWHLLRK